MPYGSISSCDCPTAACASDHVVNASGDSETHNYLGCTGRSERDAVLADPALWHTTLRRGWPGRPGSDGVALHRAGKDRESLGPPARSLDAGLSGKDAFDDAACPFLEHAAFALRVHGVGMWQGAKAAVRCRIR